MHFFQRPHEAYHPWCIVSMVCLAWGGRYPYPVWGYLCLWIWLGYPFPLGYRPDWGVPCADLTQSLPPQGPPLWANTRLWKHKPPHISDAGGKNNTAQLCFISGTLAWSGRTKYFVHNRSFHYSGGAAFPSLWRRWVLISLFVNVFGLK